MFGRLARGFASPTGVLIIIPTLVIAVGLVVLLLGRRATRDSTESMARHQLAAQAIDVQHDIGFALDQAGPILASLRLLAEPALATPDAVGRMRDVVSGRPGVAFTSIIFPTGAQYLTFTDPKTGELQVAEQHLTPAGMQRSNFSFTSGEPRVVSTAVNDYDPRTRERYKAATEAKARVWLPPRPFSVKSGTGISVAEPVYDADGALTAVMTIDFDVADLSEFIGRAPLAGARTVMFNADGTILAYPSAPMPQVPRDDKLLDYRAYEDPALDALFAALGTSKSAEAQRFLHLSTSEGDYLASIAVIGGKHAGIAAPVEWFLATLVPEKTLFGASWRLGRETIIASAAALLIALGVALMFAWNLVRMRRSVSEARAEARSAVERAQQLGSYQLVERLGGGGMGEVWRAQHQLLAREAAIKLVRADALVDPAYAPIVQERFRREAQTLASLRSRHTIALYDYGVTADGAFFYVMELLDGVDLAQLVMKHGPQPAARVISILTQACQSLGEAHDAGLFHRDIKPANLFICRAADEVDIVKLLDFGIVHNMSDPVEPPTPRRTPEEVATASPTTGERLTMVGTVIGTPGYIAPEQAVGAALDSRGDLYALGCVAWWLLTGVEVFPRPTEDEVIHAHVKDPVPDLRALVRGWLPPELEALIMKCLEKKPHNRPPDARTLAEALFAIEIPAEHAWTRQKQIAWWNTLDTGARSTPEAATVAAGVALQQPAAKPPAEAGTVAVSRMLVPVRDEAPKASANARTIDARPSRDS
ncbi:MAG: serine/threonine protein kinase [Myxococcales bacterium]|nr:serine/threonine protein kinase [Myxococcales bacterium]